MFYFLQESGDDKAAALTGPVLLFVQFDMFIVNVTSREI